MSWSPQQRSTSDWHRVTGLGFMEYGQLLPSMIPRELTREVHFLSSDPSLPLTQVQICLPGELIFNTSAKTLTNDAERTTRPHTEEQSHSRLHFTFKNTNQTCYKFIKSLEGNISIRHHDIRLDIKILQKTRAIEEFFKIGFHYNENFHATKNTIKEVKTSTQNREDVERVNKVSTGAWYG